MRLEIAPYRVRAQYLLSIFTATRPANSFNAMTFCLSLLRSSKTSL